MVRSFLNADDISWQALDCVTIRQLTEAGKTIKTTQQVRYMMTSLREAYKKFTEQHSGTKMSLSKFCELQPPNVKLFGHLPHQVCLCSYHENVRLLLVALKEHSSLRAVWNQWNGTVEWNTGMEYWNGVFVFINNCMLNTKVNVHTGYKIVTRKMLSCCIMCLL